jgi:hypothetical protein
MLLLENWYYVPFRPCLAFPQDYESYSPARFVNNDDIFCQCLHNLSAAQSITVVSRRALQSSGLFYYTYCTLL